MRVKHKDVHVRISRRILWVGSQAYPLAHVVRIQPAEVRLRRIPAVKDFFRRVGATLALAALGLIAMACAGRIVPTSVWVVFWLCAAALLIFHSVRLIRLLLLPKLYVLRVATAGTEHAAVVSTDREKIHDLAGQVADAIDNPEAEFEVRVDNIEFIYGDKVGGDKVLGDKTVFEGAN
jgi:hypothetical protein